MTSIRDILMKNGKISAQKVNPKPQQVPHSACAGHGFIYSGPALLEGSELVYHSFHVGEKRMFVDSFLVP